MRLQTAKLRNRMKALGNYEFEFLQGIMQTKAHDPVVAKRFKGPFYSWYDVQHDGGDDMEYGSALLDDDVTFSYPGATEAIDHLNAHIDGVDGREGRYVALLGFSQGGILITMLTALRLERARRGLGPGPSWSCNALVCSMPVRSNDMAKNLQVGDASPLAFPSVIAQGLQDPFYEWCRRLPRSYVSPEVMDFDEGHRFPHAASSNADLADAIHRQVELAAFLQSESNSRESLRWRF